MKFHYVAEVRHLASRGRYCFWETEKMETTLLSCLRAAVMAAADIKPKQEEIRVRV